MTNQGQSGVTEGTLTPGEYLAQHELTSYLKGLGISDEQLAATRFKQQKWHEETFVDWIVIDEPSWPQEFDIERRVWCALRWLIIDNPSPSADTRSAWDFVGRYLFHLHDRLTARMKKQQSVVVATEENAKKGQGTRDAVVTMARELKAKNSRLSKTAAARKISKATNAPCKYDQAKRYLDEGYDGRAWKDLGNAETELPN